MKLTISFSKACSNCGGGVAVALSLDGKDRTKETENELGGMFCIRSLVTEIDVDGDVVLMEEEW